MLRIGEFSCRRSIPAIVWSAHWAADALIIDATGSGAPVHQSALESGRTDLRKLRLFAGATGADCRFRGTALDLQISGMSHQRAMLDQQLLRIRHSISSSISHEP